jgi:hypothetical protein
MLVLQCNERRTHGEGGMKTLVLSLVGKNRRYHKRRTGRPRCMCSSRFKDGGIFPIPPVLPLNVVLPTTGTVKTGP